MRIIIIVLTLCCFSFPAAAQDSGAADPTRIAIDQGAEVIRIIVGGDEVAQFTSSGLLVYGDINYGGMIRDGGPALENSARSDSASGAEDATP